MIYCASCSKGFEKLFEDEPGRPCTQAYECAADIFEREGIRYLTGAYGSTKVDGELYKVHSERYKTGTVCDDCIQFAMDSGDIELILGGSYFGIDL